MKSDRSHSSLTRRLSIVSCLSLVAALVLLPAASLGQVPADIPSGFQPGLISYFAGNGNNNVPNFSDGSVPTQVSIGGYIATDSHGNVYIIAGGFYMVYAGGEIPTALANVTTNATPAVTPEAGRIYNLTQNSDTVVCPTDNPSCEGLPLNQISFLEGFNEPSYLVIDPQDNLYFSDADTNVVRRIDAATSNVTTVAGQYGVASSTSDVGDGGPATSATLNFPEDIKLDQFGNLYIDDNFNDLVRVVYLGNQAPPLLAAEGIDQTEPIQKGNIYTVAGQFFNYCTTPGECGDGGSAIGGVNNPSAGLGYELSIGVDAAGDLYIADAMVDSAGFATPYVRMAYAGGAVPTLLNESLNPNGGNSVTPTAGNIYAVTGYGLNPQFGHCTAAPCGDGGLAADVQFGSNSDAEAILYITLDGQSNLYIADALGDAVRKIDTSGYASTIAGIDNPNQTLPSTLPPQGGLATSTTIGSPFQISFDEQNNLYIDSSGFAGPIIWKVAPLLAQSIDFPEFTPVTYGVNPISLAATASSGLSIQYSETSTPAGIAHLNGSQLLITGAGSVTVTASQPGNNTTYLAAAPVTQTLTVNRAPLTVTANPASKVQGSANPAFTASITGFVNSDTAATPGVFTGAPTFSTTATTSSPFGDYPIVPAQGSLSSTNYTFANFVDGTLTITGSTQQTINFPAFSPSTVNYGQAPIALSATATSEQPVSFELISGPGRLSGPNNSALTITGAGKIIVQAVQEGFQQYAAAQPVSQTLIVNPAPLTVTGPTVTVTYGTTIDPTTFPPAAITGFVGMDTQASVLTGSAQYTTTVTGTTANAGTYPITVGLGSILLNPAASANYTIVQPLTSGSLVVNPAAQTIQFNPVPSSQIYGNSVQLTATSIPSGLPVSFTATGPASFPFSGVLELNGVGTVTVTAIQQGSNNYSPAPPVTQTLNVSPAPLNIGVAKESTLSGVNYVREQGAQNPVFQPLIGGPPGTSGAFVLSDSDIPSVITGMPVLTTTATPDSPPGDYPIVVSQGTLSAPNYTFVFLNGTLEITPPGSYAITVSPTSLTVPTGLSRQATLTLTPANNYQGTVTLTCGPVPANVSCVISPSSYVFPGPQANGATPPAQGTVTVTANASTVVGALHANTSISRAEVFLLPAGLAGMLLVFARRRVARKSGVWTTVAMALALGAGAISLSSCGGSAQMLNAAPGTTQIMITGSGTTVSGSGAVTASVPLTVTIQ